MSATLRGSTPYPDGVAAPYPYASQRSNVALLRDLAALVLLVAGLAGLVVVGFAVDWRLGVAALSTVSITAGVALGYSR